MVEKAHGGCARLANDRETQAPQGICQGAVVDGTVVSLLSLLRVVRVDCAADLQPLAVL